MTTRDEPGRLDSLLAEAGADVVHVPLISIGDAPDGGVSLAEELARLDSFHWLIVTSKHGASRVARAAAQHPAVQLGAVGARTGRQLTELAGRAPVVMPGRHTAASLVDAMPSARKDAHRVLVVQADRADDTLASGLRTKGFEVNVVVGYSTRLRAPTATERRAVLDADAVAFASGSAAQSWADAFGSWTPPVVVAIGSTTSGVATRAGLEVTHVSTDHTVEGLVAEITSVFQLHP